MKRLESNLLNMALSLTLISLVAAGALGGIYMLTKEPIEKTNEANKLKAKTDVLPQVQDVTFAEPDSVVLDDGYLMIVYRAADADGNPVGAAVETSDKNGFNGLIRLMVGFDNDGVIQGYSVLEQAETPGLGANMPTWFKTDKNRQNIVGLNPQESKLEVTKDGGDVDAITAATISSRAFLRAVQRAYNAYAANANSQPIDISTGATTHVVPDSVAADTIETVEPEVLEIQQPEPVAAPKPVVQEPAKKEQPKETPAPAKIKPETKQVKEAVAKKDTVKPVEKKTEEVAPKEENKDVQPVVEKTEQPVENIEQPVEPQQQSETEPAAVKNDSAQ